MNISKNTKGFIAVVDDDTEVRSMLVDHLQLTGYHVTPFEDGLTAMNFLLSGSPEAQSIELILTDLRMPEMDGLSLLSKYHPTHPTVPILIMTAHASIESSIEGLRRGAFDYIIKPFKLSEISLAIEKAIKFGRLQRQNTTLIEEIRKTWRLEEILAKSTAMKNIFPQIEQISLVPTDLLILGESGTGKEIIARAIHNKSERSAYPFVRIKCTSLPDHFFESDAHHVARNGTLYLDEIGDMGKAYQIQMLKFLQQKSISALDVQEGSTCIIASSGRDLKKAVQEGNFLPELYNILNDNSISIPPLRQRIDDIPILAQHFLNKYSAIYNRRILGLSEAAIGMLMSMNWPGNVRELEALIERIVILTPHPIIQADDILPANNNYDDFLGKNMQDDPSLEELEKRYMKYVLEKTGGKKEKAAQVLGINRRTLYRKERDYGFVQTESDTTDL